MILIPPLAQDKLYTINDIYSLPDGERAELIDGQIYFMAPPTRKHQDIAGELLEPSGNTSGQTLAHADLMSLHLQYS